MLAKGVKVRPILSLELNIITNYKPDFKHQCWSFVIIHSADVSSFMQLDVGFFPLIFTPYMSSVLSSVYCL